MLKSGCYEDVFQTSGVLQQFSSRCVVGGRAMTNANEMHHVKRKIADVDACSLYPGAMFLLDPRVSSPRTSLRVPTCMMGFLCHMSASPVLVQFRETCHARILVIPTHTVRLEPA